MTVAAGAGNDKRIEWVAYSAHGKWFKYASDVVQAWHGRPYVVVARGTHANYPRPCARECKQSDGGTPETQFNGQRPWERNSDAACNSSCIHPLPEKNYDQAVLPKWTTGSSWNGWLGRWGNRMDVLGEKLQEAPHSPALQKHFSEPWTYAASSRDAFGYASARGGGVETVTRAARDAVDEQLDAEADCDGWRGLAAAAVVCDERLLRETLGSSGPARPETVSLHVQQGGVDRRGDVTGGKVGITQLLGRPLRAGEQLLATGTISDTAELTVLVQRPGQSQPSMFLVDELGLLFGGTARLDVPRGEHAAPVLTRPDGSAARPD